PAKTQSVIFSQHALRARWRSFDPEARSHPRWIRKTLRQLPSDKSRNVTKTLGQDPTHPHSQRWVVWHTGAVRESARHQHSGRTPTGNTDRRTPKQQTPRTHPDGACTTRHW